MASYLAEQIQKDKDRYARSVTESKRRGRTVILVACAQCGADTERVAGLARALCSRCWFR